ncbi:hypothetical protein GUJ93_ZPchr0008g12209 [Zizania palustris]|uniref:Uncharacterized protein n=1 Tax=Zizania palustris TaxID=103762 RepID=A0A8J5RK56_ZIZPA|nr:hypothetical protein GUJ93_ZPchr0008g12209 [Zizania palustris]
MERRLPDPVAVIDHGRVVAPLWWPRVTASLRWPSVQGGWWCPQPRVGEDDGARTNHLQHLDKHLKFTTDQHSANILNRTNHLLQEEARTLTSPSAEATKERGTEAAPWGEAEAEAAKSGKGEAEAATRGADGRRGAGGARRRRRHAGGARRRRATRAGGAKRRRRRRVGR